MRHVRDFTILLTLAKQPSHGYLLSRTLQGRPGWERLCTSTIYYTLLRLERQGLIQRKTYTSNIAPKRHRFRLTRQGYKALQQTGSQLTKLYNSRLDAAESSVLQYRRLLQLVQDQAVSYTVHRSNSPPH